MPEQRIEIKGVENIRTSTGLKITKAGGEEVSYDLVTKVTFEGELDPADIAQIHRLVKANQRVNVSIWSPQLAMKLDEPAGEE